MCQVKLILFSGDKIEYRPLHAFSISGEILGCCSGRTIVGPVTRPVGGGNLLTLTGRWISVVHIDLVLPADRWRQNAFFVVILYLYLVSVSCIGILYQYLVSGPVAPCCLLGPNVYFLYTVETKIGVSTLQSHLDDVIKSLLQ